MLPLFVLAGSMVVGGTGMAVYSAPHRASRRFRQAMINGSAVVALGVILLVIGVVRAVR